MDNLLAIARLHYRFFGRQPALARLALREMIFYDTGAQAASFQRTRERLIRLFGHTVESAIKNAEIEPSEPPLFAGWTLFCIFQVELRRWLSSDAAQLRAGLNELERAFRMLVVGFGTIAERRGLTKRSQQRKKVIHSKGIN